MLLTVEETAEMLGIGRTRAFELVRSGAIESVRIGVSRRIRREALAAYVEGLTP